MGTLLQKLIYLWLNITGRKVDFGRFPFLQGPRAEGTAIGDQFYDQVADTEGLTTSHVKEAGLLVDFKKVLSPDDPNASGVDPRIIDFYEHTGLYTMEVWPKWKAPVSWFAKTLIRSISTEIEQLNIPMDALETSYGMSSDVVQLKEDTGRVRYTCWLRKSVQSERVVYAGFYSSCAIDEAHQYEHVRVVFPLPKGNVTVILKVLPQPDGSVKLVSSGGRFGSTGYYRLHQNSKGVVKSRMVPIKEMIHVFVDPKGVLRTDHFFSWWGMTFLQLHYKMHLVK